MRHLLAVVVAFIAVAAEAQNPTLLSLQEGRVATIASEQVGSSLISFGTIIPTSTTNMTSGQAGDVGVPAYDKFVRVRRFAGLTALNTIASTFMTPVMFWRGNATTGGGGYTVWTKIGVPANGIRAGQSFYTGTSTITAPGTSPSTSMFNSYYFGTDIGQTNLFACSCGAAACSCADTGFAIVDAVNPQFYLLKIDVSRAMGTALWEATNLLTNTTSTGVFSGANQPSDADLMQWRTYCCVGATAAICDVHPAAITFEWKRK